MKRILIVGATSAIAGACARIWAADGGRFFLAARDAEKLRSLAADLTIRGAGSAQVLAADMLVVDPRTIVDAAVKELGELDIALIAHGTLPDQPACERDVETALREFAVNAASVIGLLTVAANEFERRRGGRIGVITSVAGDRGRPSNYVYGSAKAAVSVFCEGLRARLFKAGVSLTDIRPGFVATPMTQGLPLPAILVAKPATVARRIVKALDRRQDVVYAPAYWAIIMAIIRRIPRFIFKRLKL
jgi:short-subunit dehydrogenase